MSAGDNSSQPRSRQVTPGTEEEELLPLGEGIAEEEGTNQVTAISGTEATEATEAEATEATATEEAGEEAQEEGEEEAAEEEEEQEELVLNEDAGREIDPKSFDLLAIDPRIVQAANDAWQLFIANSASREAAGEALYAALFEGAPSLQSLFTTPKAVQAMKFFNGLTSFVTSLDDPRKLKILVETLAFGHLHLDVTVPRVVIFRDAILDLLKVELTEKFTPAAREGWMRLLNYVGGAIIYVKVNYAERISTLLKSWKEANHGNDNKQGDQMQQSDTSSGEQYRKEMDEAAAEQQKKKSKLSKLRGGKKQNQNQADGVKQGQEDSKNADNNMGSQSVPTTFPEMFLFNAAVMGFGTSVWMNEVLACFDNIVTNVANSARLQEECDVLALRIARCAKGNLKFAEFKSCMLASLRSLLPKAWDSAHEVAWTWLWENVERLLMKIHGQPPIWEKALGKFWNTLSEETKFDFRKDFYTRFFTLAPSGQDFFKQSNTYLHFISDKILGMTLELFQTPVTMVDDISAVGLRHVGYAIPTELFGPFVTGYVEVLMNYTQDETVVEAFRWSLGLIAKMTVRTINEGSTIVMKAINQNSSKMLKKAIQCAPRGERASWMLIVQVGTRSISPLAWSLESGSLLAAEAIIRDLLTFRADRDRYYYGADDLFKRHPDIIKLLATHAPPLLPVILDGLIWRSRVTENGMRRVNYYIKHLLQDEDGNFNKTLSWICTTRDPKLVCHPIIILVSDLVWSRAASHSFLYGKSWFLFTLLVFITCQSVLQHVNDHNQIEVEGQKGDIQRAFVFAGRVFIYICSMTQLMFRHLRDVALAYRKKKTVKVLCLTVPKYLQKWQDSASLLLTVSLLVMLGLEPTLWCWGEGPVLEETCDKRSNMRFSYTLFSMIAMFLYFTLLVDLTAVSMRISAFVLVCIRMLSEVGLFLGALAGTILTFASAISVMKETGDDFAGIPPGSFALFSMVVGTYSSQRYAALEDEPLVLAAVFVFLMTFLLLLNLLIAQLSCAYSAVYDDMVGYARLERAEIIVEIMPVVPNWRWARFTSSLRLNRKCEFNEGDLGPAGGIQVREPASANPTSIDMIRRFGGSTSSEMPWPEEDDEDADEDARYERTQKMIARTLQRIQASGHSRRGNRGQQNTGTGSLTGSAHKSGSGASEGSNDIDEA